MENTGRRSLPTEASHKIALKIMAIQQLMLISPWQIPKPRYTHPRKANSTVIPSARWVSCGRRGRSAP